MSLEARSGTTDLCVEIRDWNSHARRKGHQLDAHPVLRGSPVGPKDRAWDRFLESFPRGIT